MSADAGVEPSTRDGAVDERPSLLERWGASMLARDDEALGASGPGPSGPVLGRLATREALLEAQAKCRAFVRGERFDV